MNKIFSVVGIFDSAHDLMEAIPDVKRKAKDNVEAYTPYPIEGIEKLLGLKKSPIGGMVLVMGAIGALAGLALELWTSGIDYPQITAGKPPLSWEALVPIMFELTVLFAAFTAGLGMLLLLNRLPMLRHPMLRSKSIVLVTRDKFALAIEATGDDFDASDASLFLQEAGAASIELIERPAPIALPSPNFIFNVIMTFVIACAAGGYLTYWGIKLFPVMPPMSHMLNQPRLNPQTESHYFKDGFGMRAPVPDTVARGSLPYHVRNIEFAGELTNPLPRDEKTFRQGKLAYANNCSVCHGVLGNGEMSLTPAYGGKPANLVAQRIIDLPDGKVYHVIMMGKNLMGSYAFDLSEDERWAVIHYIRALQRAANAKDEDFKK